MPFVACSRTRRYARKLSERGRRRSRLLTWDRTAAATLDSYRRAVEGRRQGLFRGAVG